MSHDINTPNAGATSATASPAKSPILLATGAITGPLFVRAAARQELPRAGFDLSRHRLSLLSLGDLGWIQITNVVVAGLLSTALAVWMWLVPHRAGPGRSRNPSPRFPSQMGGADIAALVGKGS